MQSLVMFTRINVYLTILVRLLCISCPIQSVLTGTAAASMMYIPTLSITNTCEEVKPMEKVAITALFGFVENRKS